MNKDIAVINAKLDSITSDVSEIKSDVKELKETSVNRRELIEVKGAIRNKVSKEEFKLVRSLVYGFVSLVLLAVMGAMVSLVIIK